MIDYYTILQIEENATQDEIKHAYHKMARLFHPDNFNGSQEEAAEQMTKINEAYKILSDINKRAVYDADRQLKRGSSNINDDSSKKNNNMFTEEEKSNSVNEDSSTEPKVNAAPETHSSAEKTDTANTDNTIKSDNSSNQGCFSCLATIIKWAVCIGILYFIFNHWDFTDKNKETSSTNQPLTTYEQSQNNAEEKNKKANQSQDSSKEEKIDQSVKLKPKKVVENYFKYMKNGKVNKANELFDSEADKNFQSFTVAEYNQVITDLYYGFEKDIPTYPLFEEIRKFRYNITDSHSDKDKGYTEVNVEIENCDVTLLFGMLLEANSYENILETLSDSKLQKLLKNAIKQYKSSCMISTNVTFVLKKNQEGYWKISSISPLKDFSTVMVGQVDELVLSLNGENIGDDENEGYDEEEDMDLLW